VDPGASRERWDRWWWWLAGALGGQMLVHRGGERLAGAAFGLGNGPPSVRVAGQPVRVLAVEDFDDVADG